MKSQSLLTSISVYFLLSRVLADDDTKITDNTKIVGGVEVNPKGRYPFQVAMIDSSGNQYCGGSLVDKDWVLCAAHCAGYGSRVHVGRHDLTDDDESFDNIEIDWETPHPDYNGQTLDNDYMMVKLKQSSSKTPVKLDDGSTNLNAGADVTVMGWGTTSFQGSSSDVLMEVVVDIVSNSDCNSDYSGQITSNMVCASRSGKDSCQGDSGGPLIVKGSDVSGDVQVGVVSWGNGCADPDYPGVYARVSSKISWIKEQIASGTRPDGGNGGDGGGGGGSGDGNWGYEGSGDGNWGYEGSGGGGESGDNNWGYSGGGDGDGGWGEDNWGGGGGGGSGGGWGGDGGCGGGDSWGVKLLKKLLI